MDPSQQTEGAQPHETVFDVNGTSETRSSRRRSVPSSFSSVQSGVSSAGSDSHVTLASEATEDLGTYEDRGIRLENYCGGQGCCRWANALQRASNDAGAVRVIPPNNAAYQSLNISLNSLCLDTPLTELAPLPPSTISLHRAPDVIELQPPLSTDNSHPPEFVQPHPPYHVFPARVHHVRELTNPGAFKKTFHYELDVTDYPAEGGVDFKVGGAIGICPPNADEAVNDVFDRLKISEPLRDELALLDTSGGRWPTIWGDEMPRKLTTTRRQLLTWCLDIQGEPPSKPLLRLLAEFAEDRQEKMILMYLVSAEGQASFCALRSSAPITLAQLLHAFPSSVPPAPHLFSVIPQLMPRFYSLSNDPHISSARDSLAGRKVIEMAVTVQEIPDWRDRAGTRPGVGSGFLLRVARAFEAAAKMPQQSSPPPPPLCIPMFRGLMANPLSRDWTVATGDTPPGSVAAGPTGPLMLIGAGVGMAPFRGLILRLVRNAACAAKVWLIQGVRDVGLDALYSGELGAHERDVKCVVQSRGDTNATAAANAVATIAAAPIKANVLDVSVLPRAGVPVSSVRYVQDEVRVKADIVWSVINASDGRICVCGSSAGMGQAVERVLIDVAMEKGGLNDEQAKDFWEKKKEGGQYVTETW